MTRIEEGRTPLSSSAEIAFDAIFNMIAPMSNKRAKKALKAAAARVRADFTHVSNATKPLGGNIVRLRSTEEQRRADAWQAARYERAMAQAAALGRAMTFIKERGQ
ncbi:MAG: hypothetical protein V4597_18445 [Pseudomonadota bacterium]